MVKKQTKYYRPVVEEIVKSERTKKRDWGRGKEGEGGTCKGRYYDQDIDDQ